jgi:hypothetical protein
MGPGAEGGTLRSPMTGRTCRFPTATGPCRRPVARPGQRCYQHDGKDPIKAAADIAAELRERQRAGRRARRSARRPEPDVPMSDEQLAAVAECLNRHRVEYLLVGGAAAQLHGAPVPRTRDADVVPLPPLRPPVPAPAAPASPLLPPTTTP